MTKLVPITPNTDPIDDNERSFTYDENGNDLKARLLKGGAGSFEAEINKVPAGGAIGQVMSKQSDEDYDTDWTTITATIEPVWSGYISFADFDSAAVFTDATNGRPITGKTTVVSGLTLVRDTSNQFSMGIAVPSTAGLNDIQFGGTSYFSNFTKQDDQLTINGAAYDIWGWDNMTLNNVNGNWTLFSSNVFTSIPDGGTTGQLLAKESNNDRDTGWKSLRGRDINHTATQDKISANDTTLRNASNTDWVESEQEAWRLAVGIEQAEAADDGKILEWDNAANEYVHVTKPTGSGGGTAVNANPNVVPTQDLTKVQIAGVSYNIADAKLTANPTGTPATDLTKLTVGDTDYNIRDADLRANPSGTGTENLEKLQVDDTIYNVATGTNVEANPSGTPANDLEKVTISGTDYKIKDADLEANPIAAGTVDLTKLKVDDTVYSIPVGGGSGGGTTVLANPSGTPSQDITKIRIDSTDYTITDPDSVDVEANPSGAGTADLTKVKIGTAVYDIKDAEAVDVEANPTGSTTDDLSKLKVDDTIYSVPTGTTVAANPSPTGTEELTKLQVGATVYTIPVGVNVATSVRGWWHHGDPLTGASQATWESRVNNNTNEFNSNIVGFSFSLRGDTNHYMYLLLPYPTGNIRSIIVSGVGITTPSSIPIQYSYGVIINNIQYYAYRLGIVQDLNYWRQKQLTIDADLPEQLGNKTLDVRTSLPAITDFTVGDMINLSGELYELVANTEDSNVLRGTLFNRTSNTSYWGSAASGEVDFEFQGVSPNDIGLNILRTSLPSPPANLYIRITLSSGQIADVHLTRDTSSDTTARYAYDKAAGEPGLDVPTAGETYSIQVFSDSAFSTAQSVHTANRWEADNRDSPVNPIALIGNNDRWGKDKVPADTYYGEVQQTIGIIAEDTTYDGLTLNPTSQVLVNTSPKYFSPTLDLDDHPNGEFHIELDLTVVPVSDVNMSFVQGVSNATDEQKNVVQSNIVFASNLAEEDDFALTTADTRANGLTIFEVNLYSANTLLGTYFMRLIHNASDEAGIYYEWVGQAGGTGATLNAELRVTFTPTDTAPAPTTTVRNSRGSLEFKSIALPTSFVTTGFTNAQLGWILEPTNSWIKHAQGWIKPPLMRPAPNVIGWWFVFKSGGTEFAEVMLPFVWQPDYMIELQCTGERDDAMRIGFFNSGNIAFTPQKAFTVPANSTIEVYRAVI